LTLHPAQEFLRISHLSNLSLSLCLAVKQPNKYHVKSLLTSKVAEMHDGEGGKVYRVGVTLKYVIASELKNALLALATFRLPPVATTVQQRSQNVRLYHDRYYSLKMANGEYFLSL
jgi:hypothetical protein